MTQHLTTTDGTPISRFCFGAMQFGGNADAAASAAMYDDCRAAGINFFDTAFGYTNGQSETILGGLAKAERDKLFVATKCAYIGGATRKTIHAQFDQSRKRLGMDCVDLLYIHRWDDATPLEETFETLAGLIEDRKVRYIGVSNFAAWQVMKGQGVAQTFGTRITMLQPMYNLVKRQVEVEILPMALSEGLAVCPYSPLGGGLLTGKYNAGETGRLTVDERYTSRYAQSWMHRTAGELAALSGTLGMHPATLAVAWVATNPAITAPIISARSTAQLAPSLAALNVTLDTETYAAVSALSPAPPPATDRTEEE